MISALLLKIAGVPEETIAEDYGLTAMYLWERWQAEPPEVEGRSRTSRLGATTRGSSARPKACSKVPRLSRDPVRRGRGIRPLCRPFRPADRKPPRVPGGVGGLRVAVSALGGLAAAWPQPAGASLKTDRRVAMGGSTWVAPPDRCQAEGGICRADCRRRPAMPGPPAAWAPGTKGAPTTSAK